MKEISSVLFIIICHLIVPHTPLDLEEYIWGPQSSYYIESSFETCCKEDYVTTAVRKYQGNCGVLDEYNKRIIGGFPATTIYPWFVGFMSYGKAKKEVACGGSLVTQKHVVSAAHCFRNKKSPFPLESIYIVLLNSINQCKGPFNGLKVINVRIPSNYNEKAEVPRYDISLLTLNKAVSSTPICLPSRLDYSGEVGSIIGYGKNKNKLSTCYPYVANLLIYSNDYCLHNFKYDDYYLARKTICGGNSSVDACNADSGGPLQVFSSGKYELAGVVSYGIDCAEDAYPGVYSDVSDTGYGVWIKTFIFVDIRLEKFRMREYSKRRRLLKRQRLMLYRMNKIK